VKSFIGSSKLEGTKCSSLGFSILELEVPSNSKIENPKLLHLLTPNLELLIIQFMAGSYHSGFSMKLHLMWLQAKSTAQHSTATVSR